MVKLIGGGFVINWATPFSLTLFYVNPFTTGEYTPALIGNQAVTK